MDKKYEKQDYIDFLKREVDGLIDLCYLYDYKEKFERSANMAVVIRTLLYDTRMSTSVLKHLGDKDSIYFYNSSIPNFDDTEFMISMLVSTLYTKDGSIEKLNPTAVPKCFAFDKFENTQTFEDWWDHKLIMYGGKSFTRGDIVWITANKFGSAHADKEVDALYYDLAKGLPSVLFFSYEKDSEKMPIDNIIYALIRQITHELLCTLIDYYHLDFDYKVHMNGEHYDKNYHVLESIMTLSDILEYAPDYINRDDLYK